MANQDSTSKTLIVAIVLCVVCSIFVSAAAVYLRPRQEENQKVDKQKNILEAAGLFDKKTDDLTVIPERFAKIDARIIDLASGRDVTGDDSLGFDIESFDAKKAAKDPATSVEVSPDPATIKRREKLTVVYLVRGASGELEKLVLPIRGYGLWSTLWGFIALDTSLNQVAGITYYQHGETPGLGGEVDNPAWKAKWSGKKVFDAEGKVALHVVKGEAAKGSAHEIDGLAGATITSNGVSGMIEYWMGPDGFGPYLKTLAAKK